MSDLIALAEQYWLPPLADRILALPAATRASRDMPLCRISQRCDELSEESIRRNVVELVENLAGKGPIHLSEPQPMIGESGVARYGNLALTFCIYGDAPDYSHLAILCWYYPAAAKGLSVETTALPKNRIAAA